MLTNDLGKTSKDPYNFPATESDVESWGRLHRAIREALIRDLKAAQGDAETTTVSQAHSWLGDSEKYSDLDSIGLGFEAAIDFGLKSNAELVRATVGSAKEGKRLQELVVKQADIAGGSDIGGVDDNPEEETSAAKLFIGGGLVALIAWGASKLLKAAGD